MPGINKNPDTIANIAKRRKERLTPRQMIFLKNLHKSLNEKGGIEKVSYRQVLKDSGYSQSIADNPSAVLEAKAIKPELQSIVNKFVDVRNKALDHITREKLEGSTAKDLAVIADKSQRNINLLIGEATANVRNQTIKIDVTALNGQ